MSSAPETNRDCSIARQLAFSAFFLTLPLAFVFTFLTPAKIFFVDDQATSFIVGNQFLHGYPAVLGPPSHTGGRHLGGLYYWLIGSALWLFRGDTYRAIVFLNCLTAAGAGSILYFLARLYQSWPRYLAFAGVSLVLCSGSYYWILRDPWQPNLQLLTSTLVLLAAWLVLQGRKGALSFFVLASTLSLQLHYSALPFLVGVAAVPAVKIARTWRRRKEEPLFQLGYVDLLVFALVLLLWLPVLFYHLRFPEDMKALFRFHASTPADALGFAGGAATVGKFFYHFSPFFPGGPSSTSAYREVPWWSVGPFLAVLFAGIIRLYRRSPLFPLLLLLPLPVYALAVSRLSPPAYVYYLDTMLPLPLIFTGCAFAELGYALERLVGERLRRAAARSVLIFAALVPAVIFGCQSFAATYGFFNKLPIARWHSLAHAQAMAERIGADAAGRDDFVIFGRAQSEITVAAYYYFLPESLHGRARWIPPLKEFPGLQRDRRDPEVGYAVACPLSRATRRGLEQEFTVDWDLDGELDLSGCPVCRNCAVYRLRSKRKNNG